MNATLKYRPIMVAGTGSHVGKSVLVMGLCRVFKRRGLDVAPFQGPEHGPELGHNPPGTRDRPGPGGPGPGRRLGALGGYEPHPAQARRAYLLPDSAHGPPPGQPTPGPTIFKLKPRLMETVTEPPSAVWNARHQLVILEGAGSCAEVNLKAHDLVNLPMAMPGRGQGDPGGGHRHRRGLRPGAWAPSG